MSDSKVQEVMENMSKTLARELETIEPSANLKLHSTLENCYNRSNENPDRFAQCVISTQKKVSDIMEAFQFKMVFLSRNAQGCIAKSGDVKSCSDSVSNVGRTMIQDLIKEIEKA